MTRLAKALAKAGAKPVQADKLPISEYSLRDDGGFDFSVRGKHYLCDRAIDACVVEAAKGGSEPGVRSPDGRSEAFIRDWNLWLRDVASGKETQLTTDGVTDYGYATDNAGWIHSDRAIVVWSPDSSKIATFRQDQRKTGSMTLVGTSVGHPKVETWKYPLVGDADVTMIERVVIDVADKSVLRLKTPPDQHRSTLCDDVSCDGGWEDVQWAPDGSTLAFVSTFARPQVGDLLRVADARTGAVRDVFERDGQDLFRKRQRRGQLALPAAVERGDLVQRAQRLGQPVPVRPGQRQAQARDHPGEGNVTEVLRVDPASRTLWFRGVGRERGTASMDPYYQQFYKVSLDGGAPTLLTPEAGRPQGHAVTRWHAVRRQLFDADRRRR